MNREKKPRLPRKSWLSVLVLLLLIPATLFLFSHGGGKRYYLVSLLIIVYTLVPFFLVFERRKPQARELVVLAVLCALAVVSRAVFVWLPSFKPMAAIVIITAVAFGGEAGFVCGAVSAFVSNFFFGQGPWTPWQMFAYGFAGFLTGVLFRLGAVKKDKLPLTVYGFLLTLILIGPMLDTCTLLTMTSELTPAAAKTVYLAGLPMNAVHAVAVAAALFLLSQPLFEKLDRIRLKYGMLEF